MASIDQLVAAGGTLLIVLAVIAYNHLQVARGGRRPQALAAQPDVLLGRYATHRGHVVGEVVAVTADRLLLRQAGVRKAVPRSQAHLHEGELVLEGDIDWQAAEAAGQAWGGA